MAPSPATQSSIDRESLWGRRIAFASVLLGVALAAAKIYVGWLAHSAAVISDGFETAGDVFSSAIVYAGLWLASKPPDDEHPYGHGRYETLAGLAVGALLLLTGAAIFWNGLVRVHGAHPLPQFVLYPLVFALVLKTGLGAIKFFVARKIKSTALEADAWHDITDLVSTMVALCSVTLALVNPERFALADRVGAMIIGIIIFFLSVSVVRRVVGHLLDTMPEPARMEEIRRAALSVPGALGIEKCFARQTGLRYHVDLHLEVDPDLTVRASHDIATLVRQQIREQLPWVADVLVHVEPAGSSTPEWKERFEDSWTAVHGKQGHSRTTIGNR